MDNEELKPCICGGQATLIEVAPHTHPNWLKKMCPDLPDCKGECFVECTKCSRALSAETKAVAVKMWNFRPVVPEDFTVMVFALRYAVNRHSYAPGLICDYLRRKLPHLSKQQKEQLEKELEDRLKYQECADDIAEYYVKKLQADLKEAMTNDRE